MGTINQVKQLAEADTPLLFFACVLPSGATQYWSTHAIMFNGNIYAARVLKHNLFDLQLSADDAMDGITQLSVVLANADSALSQIGARPVDGPSGFKGTQLTVYFAFADLPTGTITTESTVLFRGIAGDPDEITEESLTLTFTNKLSLQRIPLPEVRIQRSCPWNFPSTIDQRTEAAQAGLGARYSRFYRCGYAADVPGGYGNLNAGQAFTSCDKSRASCQARGMFNIDNAGNLTRRFGGFEFVPSAIMVRTAGDKTSHLSPLLDDPAKYNDPVPIVYGQGWLKAPVIFSRNDGNLTHMEVLLGMGALQGTIQRPGSILKVVVNDIEIPLAVQGTDMTTTGWFNVVSLGDRVGNFNLDFTDSLGSPLGDPYGSMSVLSVVVPNRISSGTSLPNVEVLLQGIQLDIYNADGSLQTATYSNNPAWVILDILRRCGWSITDLNLASFVTSASFCDELISTTDFNGNHIQVPRYSCNLILIKRQSAAVVIRGIRVASSLMLRYGVSGLLELLPETTIAGQQPALPDGSNSTEPLNGGWPAYEVSDGTANLSGIVRNSNGTSTVRLSSRTIAESSNRLSVEFQDENNEYQQDSLSLVDADDSALIGYEISSQSTALGIANFSQATRVLLRQIDKSTKGNLFVQFQTSFRALKVRPGDIIALTYAKEGFTRLPFRVVKLSPSLNYQLVTVLAQLHNDDWYSDDPAVLGGAGRQPGAQVQTPRPLIGLERHNDANGGFEYFDFKVQENIQAQSNGSATDLLTVGFSVPTRPDPNAQNLPLLSLAPEYQSIGGTLPGDASFYYAVTALDSAGNEGALSFTVPAAIPIGMNTNAVTIGGLSFPPKARAFNVYRGTTPQMLYQIASKVAISSLDPNDPEFTDFGADPQPIGPPDASFDHANFYYRYEFAGPFPATSFSSNTIGCADMGATASAYVGSVVRIIEGTARGQERSILSNDQTTITVSPPWSVMPDASSRFVVCEGSWRFAAVSATSPAQFEISYRLGTVIQISGRGANVGNQEGTPDLCPLTRWALGQAQQSEGGVPGSPNFVVAAPGGGEVTLSQIGFNDLTNTQSVTSGTLQLFYWNELDAQTTYTLTAALSATGTVVALDAVLNPPPSGVIQVGTELMNIQSVNTANNTYSVVRGVLDSVPAGHSPGDLVRHLETSFVVVPFAQNFFANRASIDYLHTVSLPDVRLCAAEFFVTNSVGEGQANAVCYTATSEGGLRTLSGGQFALQVSGYLATQQNAAPPLLIQATHAVRDIRATVGQPAAGYAISVEILQDNAPYCVMTIAPGNTVSGTPSAVGIFPPPWPSAGVFAAPSPIDGVNLPPLNKESSLRLNIALQVDSSFTGTPNPGRDLTVTIRL